MKSEKKMSDNDIENEIEEKGLTSPLVTPAMLESKIKSEEYLVFEGSTFTACLLTLENGFTVLGESPSVSPENFDVEIGRKIARDNAKNKIWAMKDFYLKSNKASNSKQ